MAESPSCSESQTDNQISVTGVLSQQKGRLCIVEVSRMPDMNLTSSIPVGDLV